MFAWSAHWRKDMKHLTQSASNPAEKKKFQSWTRPSLTACATLSLLCFQNITRPTGRRFGTVNHHTGGTLTSYSTTAVRARRDADGLSHCNQSSVGQRAASSWQCYISQQNRTEEKHPWARTGTSVIGHIGKTNGKEKKNYYSTDDIVGWFRCWAGIRSTLQQSSWHSGEAAERIFSYGSLICNAICRSLSVD